MKTASAHRNQCVSGDGWCINPLKNTIVVQQLEIRGIFSISHLLRFIQILGYLVNTIQIISFPELWNGLITHLSLGHHMKIGLGIEVDANKHHPSMFPYFNQQDAILKIQQIR
jgi:hypothetical protein